MTQAPALASLFGPTAFVADDVFATKAGDVGVVWRLAGRDSEALDPAQRADVASIALAVLHRMDERFRVYSYLVKSRDDLIATVHQKAPLVVADAIHRRLRTVADHGDGIFAVDLYFVVMLEAARQRAWPWSVRRPMCERVSRNLEELQRAATLCEASLAELGGVRLGKDDIFRFLRRLVNYDSGPDVHLQSDDGIDVAMGDSNVRDYGMYLHVGRSHVRVLTMKGAPASTFADAFAGLAAIPGEGIACLEWRQISLAAARRVLADRKDKHSKEIRSFTSHVVASGARDSVTNDGAKAVVDHIGAAQAHLEEPGRCFGECSLTVVLHDQDPKSVDRQVAHAMRVMATREGSFRDESDNLLWAWAAIVPGNHEHNLRRMLLLDLNAADLAFVFAPARGNPHAGIMVWNGRAGVPYHYALKVGDVGHTLALGATGNGKSFLVGAVVWHLQQLAERTVIFDIGHSYRRIAEKIDGRYVEMGLHPDVPINPFALEPTPDNIEFLHGFVRVLLEDRDDGFRLDAWQEQQLYGDVAKVCREGGQLSSLALPRALRDRLLPWIDGGRFSSIFDHAEDRLTLAPVQVFEFSGLERHPDVLEPFLFYVLHRVRASIGGRGLTLCVMDEAWRFIQHPALRLYVQEALKQWRKLNAALFIATHAADDLRAADLLRTVVEGCPTKFFLANRDLDRRAYRDLFNLNEQELELVTTLIPKRQVYLQRPGEGKVLDLYVPPEQINWFGASAGDAA